MRKPNLAELGTARAAAVILVSLTVLGVAAGLLLNLVQAPKWTATTNVLVRAASVDGLVLTGTAYPISIADQIDESALATSQDVLTQAAQELNVRGGLTELQRHVTAAPQGSSHVLEIKATGPDAATAQRTADVVAAIFVTKTQQRLASFAASLPPAASPLTANSEVLHRAELITRTLQPLQVFHGEQPTQVSSVRAPTALGIVGLAAGALVVLALTFLGRRIDRPRDAQRLLSLPAVHYDRHQGGPAAARLVRNLLYGRTPGELLVCPVDIDAEKDAMRFADWTREQDQDTPNHRVRLMPEPTSTVIGARPELGETAGLLLVVPRGTSRQVLADTAALLATWRPVDAVVITT
jgi:capsular polysaccharide biosynthesis protein